jgi:hypothetical protein
MNFRGDIIQPMQQIIASSQRLSGANEIMQTVQSSKVKKDLAPVQMAHTCNPSYLGS